MIAQNLIERYAMPAQNSFSFKLTADQQDTLTSLLRSGNFRPTEVPYTRIAVKAEDCSVNLYTTGKLLVQGKGAREFVEFTLEPFVLGTATVGYEQTLNPEQTAPHMGVDESGKGDFFGPLVIAAAYVDETLFEAMQKLDVKDSKAISSDKKAMAIGTELRKLLGNRFALVSIGPAAYNRLYAKMRSVNRILAWGHARAIENLLQAVPDCPKAISDQFGSKESVERALMKAGRGIELVQRHKAESDMAVAAASILARESFLYALQKMREQYKADIPKGASAAVRGAAVTLARKNGVQTLLNTVKCHFKTTDAVLSDLGITREALPPEGRIVSKPYTRPQSTDSTQSAE